MFAELALEKLLQLFPELSPYIVTFKDISEEAAKGDNSDISVGTFILQFGSAYYYIPIIAKGEALQPIDSIFDAEEQTFTPLTKAFITQATAKSQISIGKPSKIPSTVNKNPSVYELVTPPRTGKYVYASTSRLTEFLAILPDMVKKACFEKFSQDKEIYEALHKMFNLKEILGSLTISPEGPKAVLKPAVEIITDGHGLDNDVVKDILSKGYSLRGEHTSDRVAVLAEDFSRTGVIKNIGWADAGMDYEVIMSNGGTVDAYVPKRSKAAPQFSALLNNRENAPLFVLLPNGDYSITRQVLVAGEGCSKKKVLSDLFDYKSPCVPRDVQYNDQIALFSPELEFIGAFTVSNVDSHQNGVTLYARNMIYADCLQTSTTADIGVNGGPSPLCGIGYADQTVINAYRNARTVDVSNPKNIVVPYNCLVVKLRHDISNQFEVNVNSAQARAQLTGLQALGSAADIGFDGIEFIYNGKPVGSNVDLLKVLVMDEGIQPSHAENFVKKAQEKKKIRIFMSKKADFEPGEIPQFGQTPPEQQDPWDLQNGPGSQFASNLKGALATEDSQTVESTLLSELLQVANMKEYVREYLPEIKEAIDKLGRTLFLSRLNIQELSATHNSTELLSFISNLRNVYRLLGDNYIKLEQITSDSETTNEDK